MPGPCSAPNGKRELTFRTPVNDHGNIDTGKTKLKGTRKAFDQYKSEPCTKKGKARRNGRS